MTEIIYVSRTTTHIFLVSNFCLAKNSINYTIAFGPSLPPYFYLDRHIEKAIKQGLVVGTGVAVVEEDGVKFIKAYGRLKKSLLAKVSIDTIFQIGSSSKPMTATLFLIAKKQNNIDFTTPIILNNSKISKLEARHILSHTSGFKREG